MKKTLQVSGKLIETRLFKTRQAAQNFMDKSEGREMVFMKASQYYVSI
jgi:hypothetical protein